MSEEAKMLRKEVRELRGEEARLDNLIKAIYESTPKNRPYRIKKAYNHLAKKFGWETEQLKQKV